MFKQHSSTLTFAGGYLLVSNLVLVISILRRRLLCNRINGKPPPPHFLWHQGEWKRPYLFSYQYATITLRSIIRVSYFHKVHFVKHQIPIPSSGCNSWDIWVDASVFLIFYWLVPQEFSLSIFWHIVTVVKAVICTLVTNARIPHSSVTCLEYLHLSKDMFLVSDHSQLGPVDVQHPDDLVNWINI